MYTNSMQINHEPTLTFGKCKVNCLQKNTDTYTHSSPIIILIIIINYIINYYY